MTNLYHSSILKFATSYIKKIDRVVCKQQRCRSAWASAQSYQLALESMIAKPATWGKNPPSDMRARRKCGSSGGKMDPDHPGKSQDIWVSIEISIWTPPPPPPKKKKKVGPPGKCWTPSGSLEKYSFLCNKSIGPPLLTVNKLRTEKRRCPDCFLTLGPGPHTPPPPPLKKILDPRGSKTIPTGGGARIASRWRFVPVFLLGNKWQLMIFQGRSGPPAPLCLRPYQSFKQFEFTFIYLFFFAGPGQFTNRMLIISADVKGKDSMILFKIKETAHFDSGHVLFSRGGLDAGKCTWHIKLSLVSCL